MNKRYAAGVAVLFFVLLLLCGCSANPGPAPLVPATTTQTVTATPTFVRLGPEDIFRPDQSSCQADLTMYVLQPQMDTLVKQHVPGLRLVDSLNDCIHSIGEAAVRNQVDLAFSGGGFQLSDYRGSPCQANLMTLPAEKLRDCWNRALTWYQLISQDDPMVYQRH